MSTNRTVVDLVAGAGGHRTRKSSISLEEFRVLEPQEPIELALPHRLALDKYSVTSALTERPCCAALTRAWR